MRHYLITRAARCRDDRGSVALEWVVLTPAVLLFLVLVVFAGRVAGAHQSIEHAADSAARTASIARTQAEASGAGAAAAQEALRQNGMRCRSTSVAVDTSQFNRPPGTPATVTARVTCVLEFSDLAAPGVPGSRTVTAAATSPIDLYRER